MKRTIPGELIAMKILVVEDDELIAQTLRIILSDQNYIVELASDGQVGLELVETYDYDLLLLDVMLPKLDGITLCRQLRSRGYQMPILLLTGQGNHHDKAIGLDAGADDYVVKPFDTEELVARVRALLRRAPASTQPLLEWGALSLDLSSCEVRYEDKLLSTTPKEYALLELFLRNNRRVFSCNAILEHLWTYDDMPGEEAVRTHIKGLRQKLKTVGAPATLIETVYGIGYRLKPLTAESSSETVSKESSSLQNLPYRFPENLSSSQQQTLSLVAGVWHRFQAQVTAQVERLEQAAIAAINQSLSAELRQQAQHNAHTLSGSLSMFGFPLAGKLAQNIDRLLRSSSLLDANESAQFQEWVVGLRQDIERSTGEQLSVSAAFEVEPPVLLIVEGDRSVAEAIVSEAQNQGFRGVIAADLAGARSFLHRQKPTLVLLDLEISTQDEESLALLSVLQQQIPPVPVLVFASQTSLIKRVEVVRQGGRLFLQKPFSMPQVFEAIHQVLKQTAPTESKILVIDDDLRITSSLKALLEPWGLKVTTLQDPRQFWETLEACAPDLLILDVEMPYLSGIELCQVVRNDMRWSRLPILFLTAHTEFSVVNQVFSVGADDFVSKPIVGPELVARIISRLERLRLTRLIAETDPLTGVANRQKSAQNLEALLVSAERQQQHLSLAVMELDHFKSVNLQQGHAAGDAVLRQVGYLLRRSFHSEEGIGRWGGEEFVVGIYGMTSKDAVERLTPLLNVLQHQAFQGAEGQFQVTLCVGVAQYPTDGSDFRSLYRSANAALQQAKNNRLNQTGEAIVVYSSPHSSPD